MRQKRNNAITTAFLLLSISQLSQSFSLNAGKTTHRGPATFGIKATLQVRGGASNTDESSSPSSLSDNIDSLISATQPVPQIELPERTCDSESTVPKRAIILVDNFSPFHGNYLSHMALEAYGCAVIDVFSFYHTKGLLYSGENDDENDRDSILKSRIPMSKKEAIEWLRLLREECGDDMEIRGIYCESDSGLDDAERLGELLGLAVTRHDGFNVARRDKYHMNQVVSQAGINTVKQKLCGDEAEAFEFAQILGLTESEAAEGSDVARKCIVKPCRGVASDSVYMCSTLSEVATAFRTIQGSLIFGATRNDQRCEKVLLQEYATGVEYAIDIVSRNGTHKVAALWKYDKRPVNNAPFVYHATNLVDVGEDEKLACEYAMKVLDALGIKWGLTHNEIMLDSHKSKEECCRLIEVNCRQHNFDFVPMTSICLGYNALDMVLAAYLADDTIEDASGEQNDYQLDWDTVPVFPVKRRHGAVMHLVCHATGNVVALHHLEEIQEMSSVVDMEIYPYFQVGEQVTPTIDIRTDAGWVHLINDDKEEFKRDYDRIVDLMPHLFEVIDYEQ